MKLLVKRLYCGSCHKLVKGREQKNNDNTNVMCGMCGKLLWIWNGLRWKPIR